MEPYEPSTATKTKSTNRKVKLMPIEVMEAQINLLITETEFAIRGGSDKAEETIESLYATCLDLKKQLEIPASLDQDDTKILSKLKTVFTKTEKNIKAVEKTFPKFSSKLASYQKALSDMPESEERNRLLNQLNSEVDQKIMDACHKYAEIRCFQRVLDNLSEVHNQRKSELKAQVKRQKEEVLLAKEQAVHAKLETKLNKKAESVTTQVESLVKSACSFEKKLTDLRQDVKRCQEAGIQIPEAEALLKLLGDLDAHLDKSQAELRRFAGQIVDPTREPLVFSSMSNPTPHATLPKAPSFNGFDPDHRGLDPDDDLNPDAQAYEAEEQARKTKTNGAQF